MFDKSIASTSSAILDVYQEHWPGEMAIFNRFYTDLGHLSDYKTSLLTPLVVCHARMKIFWIKSGEKGIFASILICARMTGAESDM